MVRKAQDGTTKQAALLMPTDFPQLFQMQTFWIFGFKWILTIDLVCVFRDKSNRPFDSEASNICFWQGPVKCCCHGNMDTLQALLTVAWFRKKVYCKILHCVISCFIWQRHCALLVLWWTCLKQDKHCYLLPFWNKIAKCIFFVKPLFHNMHSVSQGSSFVKLRRWM